jgi:hypothetical protein
MLTYINHIKSTLPRIGQAPQGGLSAGDLRNLLNELGRQLPTITELTTYTAKAFAELNNSSTQLSMGLGKVIGIQQSFQKTLIPLIKDLSFFEESNLKLNKSFGLTSVGAAKFAQRLREMTKDLKVSDRTVFEYATELKNLTSGFIASSRGSGEFKKRMIQGQVAMRTNLGVTAEAAEGYSFYAAQLGQTSMAAQLANMELAKQLSDRTGIDATTLQRDLLEDIGQISADIQMQYGRIPGQLELATLKSKALGTSMAQLHKSGQALLNVESSIGSELEYQLLSGRRLIDNQGKSYTNAYRMAAIQGKSTEMADIMSKIIEQEGETLSNNMFARDKMAEMLGIEEAQLARMIQKQRVASELGIEGLMQMDAAEAQAAIMQARQNISDPAEFDKLAKSYLEAADTRGPAERAQATLDQIESNTRLGIGAGIDVAANQQAIDNMIAGSIKPIVASFSTNTSTLVLGTMTTFSQTSNAILGTVKEITDGFGSFVQNAAAAVLTSMQSAIGISPSVKSGTVVTPVVPSNDALIMPGKGPIIAPNKNDVIAAFRPNDTIDRTLNQNSDYTQLAAAIASALRNITVRAQVDVDTLFAATKLNQQGTFYAS